MYELAIHVTYRQSLVRDPVFCLVSLLVRPWRYRAAPAAGEPYGVHVRSIPVTPKSSHVHPYPRGPQADEEPVPAPIRYHKSRSKWAVRFCCTRKTVLRHVLPLPKIAVRVGTLGVHSIFITNQQTSKITCRSMFQAFQCLLGGAKTHPQPALSSLLPTRRLFSSTDHRAVLFSLFPLFSVFISTFFTCFCAHRSEVKVQAELRQPRSIYVPQAQQHSLQSALHRAAIYMTQQFVSIKQQSATTQAGRQEQMFCREPLESHHVRTSSGVCFVSFFPLGCCFLVCS